MENKTLINNILYKTINSIGNTFVNFKLNIKNIKVYPKEYIKYGIKEDTNENTNDSNENTNDSNENTEEYIKYGNYSNENTEEYIKYGNDSNENTKEYTKEYIKYGDEENIKIYLK